MVRTRNFIYIILATLLICSCQKDIYSPDAIKKDFFIQNIPAGFDWSNLSSVEIEVIPDDIYNGKYFYTVEVFGQNPLSDPQAALFAKGVCKEGHPFRTTAVFPNTLSAVFIRQTDPNGKKKIITVALSGQTLKCSFLAGDNQILSRAGNTEVGESKYEIDDSEFEITPLPQNVKEFDPQTGLTANQAYILRGDYTGTIDFPWSGKTTLFIEGTWTNTAGQTQLPNNTTLVILANGQIRTSKQWNLISSPSSRIEIAKGGAWGEKGGAPIALTIAGEAKFINQGSLFMENISTNSGRVQIYNSGDFSVKDYITFNNPGELINRGKFNVKNITTSTGNTNLYNSGVLTIEEKLQTNNPGIIKNIRLLKAQSLSLLKAEFINTDSVIVQSFTTEQAKLYNFAQVIVEGDMILNRNKAINTCRMVINGELKLEQSGLTLTNNTSILAQNLFMDGSDVELDSYSMLIIKNKAQFTSQTNELKGNGNDYALFRAGRMEWYQKSSKHLTMEGNLEIDCSDFDENGRYDKYYTMKDPAYFAQNGSSVKIAAGECTGEGNNTGTDNPENPTFPLSVHLTGMNYTWIVEDVYPKLGDYDMNDVVVKIDSVIVIINAENKVENLAFHTRLRAVGGVVRTGAALQLEQIAPSAIAAITRSSNTTLSTEIFKIAANGTEEGQNKAVIPLFDNAHGVMNIPNTRTMVNTIPAEEEGSTTKPEQNMTTSIKFNTPISLDKVNDIRQLNFFAIICDNNQRGVEIHMPLYLHTDKSNTPGQVQASTSGLMWGLLIPGDFRYATERADIRKAYPQFQEWVQSNKQKYQDWYDYPDTKYTYKN